jgi:hypothetical protein
LSTVLNCVVSERAFLRLNFVQCVTLKLNFTVLSKSRKFDKYATTDKKRRMCIILDENTCEERNEHKYDIASALGMAQIGSANEKGGRQRSWYK